MSQDTPMGGTGFGTSTGSDAAKRTGGVNTPNTGVTGFNTSTGTNTNTGVEICPTCGASKNQSHGLDQFLGRLGISEEMMNNLKTSMQNVDVDEYLNTARDYLKDGGTKASSFAKENPGKVAAGVAVLAVGAGLLISAMNRD
jgi:hypothetical protein